MPKGKYTLADVAEPAKPIGKYTTADLAEKPQTPTVPVEAAAPEKSYFQQGAEAVGNAVMGAAKGAGHTLWEAGKRAATAGGTFIGPNPDAASAPTPEIIKPEGAAQNVGYTGEQIGEFFLPGGAIGRGAKAVEGATAGMRGAKALNFFARSGLEAAGTGAVTAAQGGTPEEISTSALLGAATPAVSAVTGKVAGKIKDKAAPVLNRAMGVLPKGLRYGKDPAREVMDRNLGGSVEQIGQNVNRELKTIGPQIEATLTSPQASAKRGSIQPVYDFLDDAARTAEANKNPDLFSRTNKVREELTHDFKVNPVSGQMEPDLSYMLLPQRSPFDINQAKRAIGDRTKVRWESAADTAESDLRKRSYGILGNIEDQLVPEVAPLNKSYSNLKGAQQGLEAKARNAAAGRGGPTLFGDTLTGVGGGLIGNLFSDDPTTQGASALAAIVLRRARTDPRFLSRLGKLDKPAKAMPSIMRNIYLGKQSNEER